MPLDGDGGGLENALDRRHLVVTDPAALHQRYAKAHVTDPLPMDRYKFAIKCSVIVAVVPVPPRSRVRPCRFCSVRLTDSSMRWAAARWPMCSSIRGADR